MKKTTRAGRRLLAVLSAPLVLLLFVLIVGGLPGKPVDRLPFSRTYTDRDGKLLRIFLTPDEKYRCWRSLAQFPPELVEAVLMQEDRYFYRHPGVNPVTLAKAFRTTYLTKERRVGASTITMQLARLLYGVDSSRAGGKVVQIFLSLWLEARYSKQEILEAYLNLPPCGRNIEGFPAAAYFYFGSDVRTLSLSQLLLLCVIPQNPTRRAPSPSGSPQELLAARATLFDTWLAAHPEDAPARTDMEMPVAVTAAFPFRAPHHTEYLEKILPEKPWNIRTALDLELQERSEIVLERYLDRVRGEGARNASLLVVDWRSMEIVAAIGSADYRDEGIQGQVNGTTARRSPGSTLKPFIYAMALDQGLIHSESMLKDTPTSYSEYTPDNFSKDFVGPIAAWRALVDSRNIPAITLASGIRDPGLYDFLSLAGIGGLEGPDHYGLSIVLGSAGLTMMELARLYALLPNGGSYRPLVSVLSASASSKAGPEAAAPRLLSPAASWITLSMLERNPPPFSVGSGGALPPVAYKTGTSIGFKDAWTVAVCDRWIVCAWLGNFDGRGAPVFNGRLLAAPLAFRVIESLVASTPRPNRLPALPPPAEVSAVGVCEVSGAMPGPHCAKTVDAWFIPGVSPITPSAIHREIAVDTRTGWRTDEREGPHVKKVVREFWPSDLLESFRLAGLPRLLPPPYPDETPGFAGRHRGFPPVIVSPLANATYVLRLSSEERRSLVLVASADADSRDLFWFADNVFIGKSAPNGKLLWEAAPGRYSLTVLDEQGRSASTPVVVELRE